MFKNYWSLCFMLGAGVALLALTTAPAQRRVAKIGKKKNHINEVIQQFPTKGKMQSAWKVHWRTERGSGLIIQDAFFKKGPNQPWIQILGEARLAEALVPYHRGSPRFWDVSYNFPLNSVTTADGGAHGKLLRATPANKRPTVVQEVRDCGLLWKDYAGVRRSEQLVLWGSLSAANYRYIIEYNFRDDGLIRFKVGSTGHNYSGSEWVPHMHNALWRIDVNLGDPAHNTVELCERLEPDPNGKKTQAVVLHNPFNGDAKGRAREGFADFDPGKFTMLRIVNTQKKNVRKKPWTYDLVPYRMGNSRHFGNREECTHHDFWVTKNRKSEIHVSRVPKYIKDPNNPKQAEDISDTDVVIWYSDPGFHDPRSEDGEMRKNRRGNRRFVGVTPIMWTRFELKPRDFWDRSPFYPYKN